MITSKQWHIFIAAPHRVMFFGGALQAIAVMVWLLTELLTRYGVLWHPIPWTIAPSAAHAWLMIYGLFSVVHVWIPDDYLSPLDER